MVQTSLTSNQAAAHGFFKNPSCSLSMDHLKPPWSQPFGGIPASSTTVMLQQSTWSKMGNPSTVLIDPWWSSSQWDLKEETAEMVPPGVSRLSVANPLAGHHQGLSLSLSTASVSDIIFGNARICALSGSKYLSAVRELLDEVVNAGKNINDEINEKRVKQKRETPSEAECENVNGPGKSGPGAEVTTAERQELQMKKALLVSMLDEVDRRYKQYRHQMHSLIASFEQAAGHGSARAYTARVLQTISRQFRCLKDTVTSQIKATNKSLVNHVDNYEKGLGSKAEINPRLRFVDHRFHEQRLLKRLGLMHSRHDIWNRLRRGLPERAVSALRAWLFEHFLHPYPKDSDKMQLAEETGLTRSQVSNWFINARVRLWKPMVEEMYIQETRNNRVDDQIGDSLNVHDKNSKNKIEERLHSKRSPNQIICPSENSTSTASASPRLDLIGSPELIMEDLAVRCGKRARSSYSDDAVPISINCIDHMEMITSETTDDSFPGFSVDGDQTVRLMNPEIALMYGNSISLSLGLTRCENAPIPAIEHHYLAGPVTLQAADHFYGISVTPKSTLMCEP